MSVTMENEAFNVHQKKRSRPHTNYNNCIICQKTTPGDKLHRLTERGYPSLCHAVTMRNDEVAFRLEDDVKIHEKFLSMQPVYHASCRSRYTNPKTVGQKRQKHSDSAPETNEDATSEPSTSTQRLSRSMTSSPINYKTVCFICGRTRHTKGDRILRKVASHQRQNSIWAKAKELNDDAMLIQISGYGDQCVDMVSQDFQYHVPCMNKYLSQRPTQKDTEGTSPGSHEVAWSKLISAIEGPLFNSGCVYYVTTLRDMYRQYLEEQGVDNGANYKSENIIKRMKKHYSTVEGCRVNIVPQQGTSSLCCSSELTIGSLLKEVEKLKQSMVDSKYTEDSDDEPSDPNIELKVMSYHTARDIRAELKRQAKSEKQAISLYKEAISSANPIDDMPYTANVPESERDISKLDVPTMDISYAGASDRIPNKIYNHIAWLLTDASPTVDSSGRVPLNRQQHEKVLNLSQDICANVSGMAMPKQVGMAIHILKATRSKETVTLLNRFGNSISYTDAQRYITAMAASIDEQTEDGGIFIPEQLKPDLFMQCAFDNLDFHEFTKDGRTMHGTTHIFFQQAGASETTNAAIPIIKPRRSAVSIGAAFETQPSHLSLKDRQHSRSLVDVDLLNEEGTPGTTEHLDKLTTLWLISQIYPTPLLDGIAPVVAAPTWSVFQDSLLDGENAATVIGYGSFFPKSPTNPDVVQKSLEYCMQVTRKLGQDFTVVTVDQAIYEIVLALQKKHPDKYGKLVLRMGGFHIAQNFLGAIGNLMKGSGLEDILVEGQVCLRGTANKIISGKDYYAMLRAHTLVFTAVFKLYWDAFEKWLLNEGHDLEIISALSDSIQEMLDAIESKDTKAASKSCAAAMLQLSDINNLLAEFNVTCTQPTSRLWLMYMDMVMILKRYIHAERDAIWKAHLAEAENMLPYLVAAGHYKYVASLPHYLKAMKELPTVAPEIADKFAEGMFTVRQITGSFNGVWTDMALEKTYNRDAKTHLMSGITQQPAAMEKYLRALPLLTAVSEQTKVMAHMKQEHKKHHEDSPHLSLKESECMNRIAAVIDGVMINPFTCTSNNLLNISTGEKALSTDLVDAKMKGLEAMAKAAGKDKVIPLKLQTFKVKGKQKPSTAATNKQLYQQEQAVIRNLYFHHDLDEEKKVDVFGHEWTNYPASLFEADATLSTGFAMRKGNKSVFLDGMKSCLAEAWPKAEETPDSDTPSALIIDAMAFVQRNQTLGATNFHQLQKKYQQKLINNKVDLCDSIHFVGDRYDVPAGESLKLEEREKRESGPKGREYEPHHLLAIPDWKTYLSNPLNKANLLNYIGSSWIELRDEMPENLSIVIGGLLVDPGKTVCIKKGNIEELPDLSCGKHEEADTRVFAHAAHCANLGYQCVIVQATDTDIIITAIYFIACVHQHELKELWIQKGDTYIPAHKIANALEEKYGIDAQKIASVLLAVYILTGCDTVSYPYRRGKKRAVKIALENITQLLPLAAYGELGHDLEVDDDVVSSGRFLFKALYDRRDFTGNLDALRAHLFSSLKGDLRSLPPTEDAFKLHLLRALHQIAINKRAHIAQPTLPDPTSHGRMLSSGKLVPQMMGKDSQPKLIKDRRYCKCKKGRCIKGCPCAKANVMCAIACLCAGDPTQCARVAMALQESDDSD